MNANPAAAEAAPLPVASPWRPPRWTPTTAEAAALLAGPVLATLEDASVLAFEGADAPAFLQGQTTIDIAGLGPGQWQLGGYCTPKGRLLAIFGCWRTDATVRMLLPAEIAPAIARRLRIFVLRAKVTVQEATAEWTALGAIGAGASAALEAAGIAVPATAGALHAIDDDGCVVRLPAGEHCPERLLLIVRAGRAAHWRTVLGALAPVGPALWWWAQVDAAVPAVVGATQELFVPQAVNLEVLGGVNFRKGCYPGQEVVARSQYLGKLRRRMFLAHAGAIGEAADVFQDGADEPVGRIVLAAGAPGGGWDLLFECPTERTAGAALHAGAKDAPPLQIRPLPYELFDPTA